MFIFIAILHIAMKSVEVGSYLLNKPAEIFSVEDDSTSGARPKSDVMILGCLEDEMTALREYSRPANEYNNPALNQSADQNAL